MPIDLWERDEIRTADGLKLGIARSLHLRPEERVNPAEQLYAAYLEVENFELGDAFYVPLDFVQERDRETGHLILSVPMKQVQTRTWSRMPEFVATMEGKEEKLPPATAQAA